MFKLPFMRKRYFHQLFLTGLVMMILGSSCIKDRCTQTYTYLKPVYRTTAEVRANIKSNAPVDIQRTGKIYLKNQFILMNEPDKGIHIIDNSNPYAPKNVAFIDIPGNIDLAVKGNILYADSYTDLVAIDISNPLQAKLVNVTEGVFPHRQYWGGFAADTSMVITTWESRDTTVVADCGTDGFFGFTGRKDILVFNNCANCSGDWRSGLYTANSPGTQAGIGGSMARFTLVNNNLYTVSHSHLNVFNVANAEKPSFRKDISIGWDIETIYPFKDRLFIGSMSGMYIFNISNPDEPVQTGTFTHVRSCDPVVADDDYAYVTLRNGSQCNGFVNQLDVVDVKNLSAPFLLKSYPFTNPHGLSKDGDILLICDGRDGLKTNDASDPNNIKLLSTVEMAETFDVIAWNGLALVVATDGLYQYEYSNPSAPKLISKITF
jgi:hypothetical protein